MTLEEFSAITRVRVPTPSELVEFAAGMGWRIQARADGTAALKADRTDPLAVSLAKMLSREPYRSGVLAEAQRRWRELHPEPVKPKAVGGREWRWRHGQTYQETPDDEWLWGHPERHPAGAWWVREDGGEWRRVPGRGEEMPGQVGGESW